MTAARPTPAQIDDLCIAYDNAKIAAESAQQRLSSAKGDLLAVVKDYGYTPAHAEKTMRLEGQLYIADATVASTVEINDAQVEELQSELSRLKKPKVFRGLFQKRIKYTLLKDAGDVLKIAIGCFTEEVQMRLLGIFASCFAVNSKAPSLSVDLADVLRKKEEAAAAKKASKAKKGGKQ
jgi:hypothetical protein